MIKDEEIEISEIEEEDMGDTEEIKEPSDIGDTPEGRNAKTAKEILASLIRKNDIQYNNKNYSVEWLVDRLGSGKFKMPKYQRKYVWEDVQVTALIVSILKKIPIPKLYGYYTESESEEQMTLVIDGQQRLTSLFMYYWGIFPKSKNNRINYADKFEEISKYCKEYYDEHTNINRKKEISNILKIEYQLLTDYQFIYKSNEYDEQQHSLNLSNRGESTLSPKEKFRLLDRELEFLIVQGHNYSDAVELFRVYNSAGTPLSTQEIRNGIYQNNHLYKRINIYSDHSLAKELHEEREFDFNENWYHFSGTKRGSIGDKKEIKKLFQLLSYYFVFTHEKDKNEKEKFIEKMQDLLNCLKSNNILSFETFEKDEEKFTNYKKFYGRKGSLENMINDYSEYCADNGNNKNLLESEFKTVKQFFDATFEDKIQGDKINFTNIVMIYIILRANNKLSDLSIPISREAIYYDCKGYGLNSEGFYYRIKQIWKTLKNKGVI